MNQTGEVSWFIARRSPALRWGAFLLASVVLMVPDAALACGGPCDIPEVRDVLLERDKLTVVTNFGLLLEGENGFALECDEVMGGPLLGAAQSSSRRLASTTNAFVSQRGSCDWSAASAGANNTWFLDFALIGEAQQDAGDVYALLIDTETQELRVVRSIAGADFETLASFSSLSGLRQLEAGGVSTHVYATGYTFGPRTWHVTFPDPESEEWQQQSFEVEDDAPELRPIAVDPMRPARLWLRAQATNDTADELWRFDAETSSLARVFALPNEERLADIAFDEDRIWLAGQGGTRSTLYTALWENDPSFAPLRQVDVMLSCLEVSDGDLYACNNDFTRYSPWLVARSTDEGESFVPLLQLVDLPRVDSCAACSTTSAWLFGTFGVLLDPEVPDGGRPPPDRGFSDDDLPADQTDASSPEEDDSGSDPRALDGANTGSGCGCRVLPRAHGATRNALWLVLSIPARRRRRHCDVPFGSS